MAKKPWLECLNTAVNEVNSELPTIKGKIKGMIVGKLDGKMAKLACLTIYFDRYAESLKNLMEELQMHLWVGGLCLEESVSIPSDVLGRLISIADQGQAIKAILRVSICESLGIWNRDGFGVVNGLEVVVLGNLSPDEILAIKKRCNWIFWLDTLLSEIEGVKFEDEVQPIEEKQEGDIFCGVAGDHIRRVRILLNNYEKKISSLTSRLQKESVNKVGVDKHLYSYEIIRMIGIANVIQLILDTTIRHEFELWDRGTLVMTKSWEIFERPSKISESEEENSDFNGFVEAATPLEQ